jgi:hypothetical protein
LLIASDPSVRLKKPIGDTGFVRRKTLHRNPSLDQVMSSAEIEKKVADYLHNSQALEDYWQRPITAEPLQAEMERFRGL